MTKLRRLNTLVQLILLALVCLLGFGFLWSDLVCYVAGVGFGVMIDIGVSALKERQN